MDVLQTGTNIATVKISELPKSTETAGRATLATNEQTNESEALELTAVTEATQTALDAAQTATQSSQTALASADTANQAAQAADTARENIAGDLAQKSSMFTGAIMGKGRFAYADPSVTFSGNRTLRVVFKTGDDVTNKQVVIRDGFGDTHNRVWFYDTYIAIWVGGKSKSYHTLQPNTLYEAISIYGGEGQLFTALNGSLNKANNGNNSYKEPTDIVIGSESTSGGNFTGTVISVQLFNFAFSEKEVSISWNGGHPELWRVPDAWRKEDSPQRVVVDLIPSSLTPTVWKDISGQGNDIPYVPFDSNPAECEMAYENMGFPDTIIGTEAPAVIPNFVGQRYIDMTNKAEYTAFGTTSASDWK